MRFVSVRDLRGKGAEIWRRLANEKEIVVTSNGRPIAVLSAVSEENLEDSLTTIRRARAMTAVSNMQLESIAAGLDKITIEEINEEIRNARKRRSK